MADRTPDTKGRRSLVLFLAIVVGLVVYAFAFQKTQVSLDEIRDPGRLERLETIIQALASPNLTEYSLEETTLEAFVLVPCRPGVDVPPPDTDGPHIVVTPSCGDPGDEVVVEGFGLAPRAEATIAFVPKSEFNVTLRLGRVRADENGRFTTTVELPDRPADEPQKIVAVTRVRVGSWFSRAEVWEDRDGDGERDPGEVVLSPRISENAIQTWDKIIETVALALVATTAGTALAVPLSFVAARNLMRDIRVRRLNLVLSILAIPVGVVAGVSVVRTAARLSEMLAGNLALLLLGLVVAPYAVYRLVRLALPPVEEEPPTPAERAGRAVLLAIAAIGAFVVLFLLADLAIDAGGWLETVLGAFGFIGRFFVNLGDILKAVLGLVGAFAGAGVFMSLAGRLANVLHTRLPATVIRPLTVLSGVPAFAMVGYGIGWVIEWLYRFEDPTLAFAIPTVAGALLGLWITVRPAPDDSSNVGLTVYYIARTVFNTLRSIEPLVMVIVFVVWVGFGPFAGSLALGLHTTAALAKLYSEQVESILPGPLEAIRATGATRLQTIIYAVVPQIVPPYISFTMYRWDINVRMSTIIGFAGGGGIGFLLQQNINLLQYQDAAAQMLAIAIVVATMDYISSRLRERLV